MKKILLVDTAFAAMPIYNYLVEHEDAEVWVMGNREGDALASIDRERWIKQDYSDVQKVRECVQKYEIDYVVPGCTDISIETCLQLGVNPEAFDSYETYNKLGNKEQFREVCRVLDLPSPQVFSIDDFPREGRFICKPVDAYSGRGVSVVDGSDLGEITRAYEEAVKESRTKKAIIEEYADGQLYSFSAFIEKCKVQDFFIVKEGSSVNPYAVDTSYVDNMFEESIAAILRESIEKLSEYLKLKDGLLHTQFILAQDRPYIIEMSRRAPGDLYSYLIESSTGYRYAAKYASYFIDEDQHSVCKYTKHIIRHTVASERTTWFLNLKFLEDMQMYTFFPLAPLGSKIEKNQKTRAGILFSESSSYKKLTYDYERFMQRKVYVFDQLK